MSLWKGAKDNLALIRKSRTDVGELKSRFLLSKDSGERDFVSKLTTCFGVFWAIRNIFARPPGACLSYVSSQIAPSTLFLSSLAGFSVLADAQPGNEEGGRAEK